MKVAGWEGGRKEGQRGCWVKMKFAILGRMLEGEGRRMGRKKERMLTRDESCRRRRGRSEGKR